MNCDMEHCEGCEIRVVCEDPAAGFVNSGIFPPDYIFDSSTSDGIFDEMEATLDEQSPH